MAYTVVIPARYGSTRLAGKPLLDIHGKTMLQRVWEQAKLSRAERVVIATDDERILEVAQAIGAEARLTSATHPSGTDRLQQVVAELQMPDDHVVVNVQGDEPLIPPEVINQVASNLETHTAAGIATLCEKISNITDLLNPNIAKVVTDSEGMALYFSRAPIPYPRDAFRHDPSVMPAQGTWFRHIGIYAYRTHFLHRFVSWSPAPQEQLESLEQLRALHNGVAIHVAIACQDVPSGVDTQDDLDAVRRLVSCPAFTHR